MHHFRDWYRSVGSPESFRGWPGEYPSHGCGALGNPFQSLRLERVEKLDLILYR
jgi:hypothetical protein